MFHKFVLIGIAILLWGGCKARTGSEGQDGQFLSLASNAAPGVPTFYLGVQENKKNNLVLPPKNTILVG